MPLLPPDEPEPPLGAGRTERASRRSAGHTYSVPAIACPLSPVESELLAILTRQLNRQPKGCAQIEQFWVEEMGAWELSVTPTRGESAPVGLMFDGDDDVYLYIADTQVELFPYTPEMLVFIEDIVAAVMAGRVEQAGSEGHKFVRVDLADGAEEIGYFHLPKKWSRRQDRRRFDPYSGPLP